MSAYYAQGNLEFFLNDPSVSIMSDTSRNAVGRTAIKLTRPDGSVSVYNADYTINPTTLAPNPPTQGSNNLPVEVVDTVSPIPMFPNTARVLTVYPVAGQLFLPTGTYTLTLINTIPGSTDSTIVSAATVHSQTQVTPPVFLRPQDVAFVGIGATSTAPVASPSGTDAIHVAAPIIYFNTANPLTVSLYVTNTPLPAGADPSKPVPVLDSGGHPVIGADGRPEMVSATLVDRVVHAYDNTLAYNYFSYSANIRGTQLPTPPDGTTPVYFYVVASDGINHPVFSPVSNVVTLQSSVPSITGPTAVVTDFKSPFVFCTTTGSGYSLNGFYNYLGVVGATTVQVASSDVTVLFPLASAPNLNTPQDLYNAEVSGQIVYIPPTTGVPGVGSDTVTITATNTLANGDVYTFSFPIQLLPPNNVDLSVSQVFSIGSKVYATNGSQPLSSTPIAEGQQFNISVTVTNNQTPAGGTTATGVTVNFPVPAGLTLVPSSIPSSYNQATGIWTVGNLPPGSALVLNLQAVVNSGMGGMVLASTAKAVPNTAADRSSQVDINPSNQTSTVSLYVASPISGRVVLSSNSASATDPLNLPAANLFIYELEANANDTSEFVLGSTTTDANGFYGFHYTAPAAGYHVLVRIYGVNDTSQVIDNYTPGPIPTFRTTVAAPATIDGTISQAQYPSNGTTDGSGTPGAAFSVKPGGLAFLDLNGDGTWEINEPTAVTNLNGNFTFKDVVPGRYTVAELIKPGSVAFGSPTVTLSIGQNGLDDNSMFRYVDQRTIDGYAFVDTNKNGIDDPGESGVAGVTFTLDEYFNNAWHYNYLSTTSDASGMYHFDNLPYNVYYQVHEVVPTATGGTYTLTDRQAGSEFFHIHSNGDIWKYGTTSPNNYADLTDYGANNVADIDFGNTLTPTPRLSFAAFSARPAFATTDLLTAVDTLRISSPALVLSGDVTHYTVTAIGPDGNVDRGFVGTIQMASSDDQGQLESSYTFLTSDAGSHTFGLSLRAVGNSTIDAFIDGDATSQVISDPISVTAGHAALFLVASPASITPGQAYSLSLNAVDRVGNTDTNYWGNAAFKASFAVDGVEMDTSTMPASVQAWLAADAGMPSTYHFGLFDAGLERFSVTPKGLDPASIAAIPGMSGSNPGKLSLVFEMTDPAGVLAPTSVSIPMSVTLPPPVTPVTPVPPTSTIAATLTGLSQSIVGVTDAITISVLSRAGGSTIDGIHVVHFSSTDPAAILPTDQVFSPDGLNRQTFFVRFATPGTQAIIATDAATGAVLGQEIVVVNARQATPAASLVNAIYQTLLGHPADPATVTSLSARLSHGLTPGQLAATPESLELQILGSPEYARFFGGNHMAILTAIGRETLGRDLTKGEQTRYSAMLGHGTSLASVASKILNSAAARQARASLFFAGFMGHTTSIAETSHLASLLETRRGRAVAVSQLAGSAEFRVIATGLAVPLITATTAKKTVTLQHSPKATTVITKAKAHPVARLASRLVGSASH